MPDLLFIVLLLLLGMAAGFVLRRQTGALRAADGLASLAVPALLFILGANLGNDDALFARLPVLGGTALGVAVCSVAGSIATLRLLQSTFDPAPRNVAAAQSSGPAPIMGTLRILGFFLLGLVLARFSLSPDFLFSPRLGTYVLRLLIACVGVGLGAKLQAFAVIREMYVKILAVPLLIVLGTVLGSLAASLILPDVGPREALAVGCGFGYYSLSSLLIENLGHPALGAVALLANIMRELMAIICAPLLVRFFGTLATPAAGGAAAMDTVLPVIARFSGERAAIAAVFSGMCLTLLVPFLVTAIMTW